MKSYRNRRWTIAKETHRKPPNFLDFQVQSYNWIQKNSSQMYVKVPIPLAVFGSDSGGKLKLPWQARKYLQMLLRKPDNLVQNDAVDNCYH